MSVKEAAAAAGSRQLNGKGIVGGGGSEVKAVLLLLSSLERAHERVPIKRMCRQCSQCLSSSK